MTVAPELPPASAARRREAEPQLPPPARAARRHPFGPAAHATTRTTTPRRVDRSVPRRSPESTDPSVPSDRELAELLGQPAVTDPGTGIPDCRARESAEGGHRPADPRPAPAGRPRGPSASG